MMSTSPADTCALAALSVTKTLSVGRERIDVLQGVDLRVERGEFAAIMGPSGSGKSTLLGILAGLDTPSSGRVLIDGQDVTRMSETRLAGVRNQKIGMVFQAYNLIPTLSAQENVEAPLAIGKHPGDPATEARAVLELVGLSHRLKNRPHQLSGGEQQRVAIARALVTAPAIVIMDEPTGNLDQANSDRLLHMIGEVQRQTGTTFLIATHDAGVAGATARVIHLVDGRIAE
jgi:putative ABC transport system ATP-binding protein